MRRNKLTSKQEGYAQDRASDLAQSAAYRNNYDTSYRRMLDLEGVEGPSEVALIGNEA